MSGLSDPGVNRAAQVRPCGAAQADELGLELAGVVGVGEPGDTVGVGANRRNATGDEGYRPLEAHRPATANRARNHRRRVEANDELRQLVAELLAQRWSPEQISRQLRLRFPGQPAMRLCRESIYQAIYQPGSPLMRPSPLAPHRRSPLRTGRDHRRAHQHAERRRPRFEQPMLTIGQRPFDPLDRSEAGHWEGDLIIGKDQGSAIGTLVERQTRMVRLLHMPCRDGDTLLDALTTRMADLPPALLRSITWDQGTKMARHPTITRSLGTPVYFCDSHPPWQHGSNEYMNGVLRDYFPKGTDPERALARAPARRRIRAQQPPPARPRRPGSSQTSPRLIRTAPTKIIRHGTSETRSGLRRRRWLAARTRRSGRP
jgi:IS30 family transposase